MLMKVLLLIFSYAINTKQRIVCRMYHKRYRLFSCLIEEAEVRKHKFKAAEEEY